MDEEKDPITLGAAEPVTTVIQHRPLPNSVARYEDWLKEIIPVAQDFAGHQSVHVIRPHTPSGAYTILLHFDSRQNLQRWLDSEIREHLIAKIRPFLHADEDIDIKSGVEFWFTPPSGGKQAKPYKQFLTTLSVIFPLTIAIPWALQPVFAWLPWLGLPIARQFVIAAAVVATVVYLVMPRYTRLLSKWLYS